MAHADNDLVLPLKAASAMGQGVVAALLQVASSVAETVTAAASAGWLGVPIGITIASTASPGEPQAVVVSGVAKARAAASVGAGAKVGAASTNGALGPVLPSGILASFGASAGLQPTRWAVGVALTSAAAGEYFAVFVDVDQVI